MRSGVRLSLGALLWATLACAPAVLAQSDALKSAVDLFDRQEYAAADEALRKVDRDQLSDTEKAELDNLLKLAPDAIAGSRQASADLAAGDQALEAGNLERADELYQGVLGNRFALTGDRQKALTQREAVARRKAGADEMKEVAAPQPEAPPTAAPAAEPAAQPATPPVVESRHVTITDERRMVDELLWQRAMAKVDELTAKTRAAVEARDFTEARRNLDHITQLIEGARIYAEPVAKYTAARNSSDALKRDVDAAEADFNSRTADQQRREIQQRVAERERLLEQQRREKIEQLFSTASRLRKERRFSEAAEVERQILAIDPGNARALYELGVMEDYESLDLQKDWDMDLRRQNRRALTNAEEALIPWDYEILYPRNWLELTQSRAAGGAAGSPEEDAELNRKLKEEVPEVNFQDQPLEQVVETLSSIANVNISPDWQDLEANGIERDKPVSMKLTNVAVSTVLREVLSQVGGDVRLAYKAADGLIRLASKEKLDREKFVLVYDIRDLLINIPRFAGESRLDPGQALQQQQGQGGFNSGSLFTADGSHGEEFLKNDNGHSAGVSQKIMDLIHQTVEPDSWRETGGGDGSLRELNGQLIVYNTSDAHREVTDLLSQLRETRALQIAVETRFLSVTSNFLEQFGVDIDFVFNSGSAGYDRAFSPTGAPVFDSFTGAPVLQPRQFSRIGATPAAPAFGQPLQGQPLGQPYGQPGLVPSGTGVSPHFDEMTPITAQQGSLGLADPSSVNTGVPGSFAQRAGLAPALNIAGSFLDNLQVDFLIRATQANARSSVVQAPRLVLFNGQRSRIDVGRRRQYVSSVQPRLAEGAVGVQPIIGAADSGTELIVEGTIAADRKYVTLTIVTAQADEPRFERFEVQRASGDSPGIFIQLLDQTFAQVRTTVSIPDGGTVLLGGLKQVGESEVEAGVPILSKIPILKRAFTNTVTVKDTKTLLILVKAKIIIQKEAEDDAFPTFSSSGG